MPKKTRDELIDDIVDKLADNTSGAISPADVREIATDIVDSFKPAGLTDCAGELRLFVVGDSLSSGDYTVEWANQMMAMSAWAGRDAIYTNIAAFGTTDETAPADYITYIQPHAPGANDIGWISYWYGTNNFIVAEGPDDWEDWADRITDYVAQARSDGFKVMLFTLTKRPYDGEGASPYFETNRLAANKWIRENPDKYDLLIDVAVDFPDNTNEVWFHTDHLHMQNIAKTRVAQIANAAFEAGGRINCALPPAFGDIPVIGTAADQVPNTDILENNPRIFTKAQVQEATELTDGTELDWDLDAQPSAFLEIGANKTFNSPTNIRDGGVYYLTLIQDGDGGHTVDFHDVFKAVTTLEDTANFSTSFQFLGRNGKLVCMSQVAYDATPSTPPGEGDLVIENFTASGSNRGMNDTDPDTLNIPGDGWHDQGVNPQILLADQGYASLTNPFAVFGNVATDLGSGNNYPIIEVLMKFAGTSDNSGVAGIVFRKVDSNNYWAFGVNGNGHWTLWKNLSGTLTNIDGTYSYDTGGGAQLKVECLVGGFKCYVDGTAVYTSTDDEHESATLVGLANINLTAGEARWYAPFVAGT